MSSQNTRWLSWITLLSGLWLIISPFVLGYTGTSAATTNDIIVGIIVALLSAANLIWAETFESWLPWIVALLGLYEIITPWLMRFSSVSGATTNDVIFGVIILVFAVWRALTAPSRAGEEYGPSYTHEERPRRRPPEG